MRRRQPPTNTTAEVQEFELPLFAVAGQPVSLIHLIEQDGHVAALVEAINGKRWLVEVESLAAMAPVRPAAELLPTSH